MKNKFREIVILIGLLVIAYFCINEYISRGLQGRLKLNDGETLELTK